MFSRAFAVGAACAVLFSGVASATVLTFDFGGVNTDPVPTIYGDHVGNPNYPQNPTYITGAAGGPTPHIGVVYVPQQLRLGGSPNPFDPSRVFGDLQNVLYRARFPDADPGVIQIALVADPGFQVTLTSFDLAAVFNSVTGFGEDLAARSIKVLDAQGVPLYDLEFDPSITDHESLLSTFIPGTLPLRHKHFEWPGGLTSTSITIRIDLSQYITIGGTKSDRIGIDNIQFSEGVVLPAPGAATLLALGTLAIARRRRR
jgi:hypothetical protein